MFAASSSRPRNAPGRRRTREEEEREAKLENAYLALRELEPVLEDSKTRYRTLLFRFRTIQQFVTLFSERKLFDLAIHGSSILRLSLNFFSHRKNVLNKAFEDAVNHVQLLATEYARSRGEMAPVVDTDLAAQTERLSDLVYAPEAFFAKNADVVETYVDAHLDKVHQSDRWDREHWSDLRHLVGWLDRFDPFR